MTTEIHTTDLIAPCMKSVELRLAGKILGECPGAMWRGLLFHEVLRLCHVAKDFSFQSINRAVVDAPDLIAEVLRKENRKVTVATVESTAITQAEVAKLCGHYGERVYPRVKRLIGCELPVRVTIEGFEFASHLDLVWRDERGSLHIDDWKSGQDSPTYPFLNRNLQLGLYSYAVARGQVLVDGEWIEFEQVPMVSWIHLNNLAPYARKTKGKDDSGTEREFSAGEHRPLSRIIYSPDLSNLDAIEAALLERARMMEAGFFPASPSEQGCLLCPSRGWCPSFSTQGSSGDE